MKKASELFSLEKIFKETKKRGPNHEKAAAVEEIIKAVGNHRIYNFGFWLRKIGNRSYSEIMGILKELETLPDKYNKGATLTNKLTKKKNE